MVPHTDHPCQRHGPWKPLSSLLSAELHAQTRRSFSVAVKDPLVQKTQASTPAGDGCDPERWVHRRAEGANHLVG